MNTRQQLIGMTQGRHAEPDECTAPDGQRMVYIGNSNGRGLRFAVPADKAAAWQQIIDE